MTEWFGDAVLVPEQAQHHVVGIKTEVWLAL